MAKPQPKKPVRRSAAPANAYRRAPIEEETAGRRFRVRCKDWENLWGEDLSYEEANRLKEQVCTRGKSRTARVEDMEIPAPDWYLAQEGIAALPVATPGQPATIVDAELERLRKKAVATAHQVAQAAQEKHKRIAARDRSSTGTAGKVPRAPTGRPVPVVATADTDDGELDHDSISDLMADMSDGDPSDVEIARAKASADRDVADITARAREMYEAQTPDPHRAWETLTRAEQATWRFQAIDVNPGKNGAGNVGSPE